MTRPCWLLVGGSIMGVWLMTSILVATAGTKSDPKPASSAAELSTIRGVVTLLVAALMCKLTRQGPIESPSDSPSQRCRVLPILLLTPIGLRRG